MIHQTIISDAERKRLIDCGGFVFRVDSFNEFAAVCVQRIICEFVGAVSRLHFS